MAQPRDDESSCAVCGARVSPETGRTFALGPERDLCFVCSVERGGEYDEETDRWIVPPRDPSTELRDERV